MVPPNHPCLIGFSITNPPFWGFSPYFWFNIHHLTRFFLPSLGNHLSNSTACRIMGIHPQNRIATSPTSLGGRSEFSHEEVNPFLSPPMLDVNHTTGGLVFNQNPASVPMVPGIKILLSSFFSAFFPSVSRAQYTRCHLLLLMSTSGSIS